MPKTHLVISSGGMLGIAAVGTLSTLDLTTIHTYVGSSVGSLISLALVLGYTCDEMYRIVMDTDFSLYISPSITLLINSYGLDSCETLMKYILSYLHMKEINLSSMTFSDLFDKYKKKLVMTGANIQTSEIEWFSKDDTPDMLVIDALRITISIPILFAPIKAMNTDAMNNDAMNNDAMNNDAMNNDDVAVPTATYLIDGGVYSMYPIEYCIDIPMDDIIGILLLNCGRTCQITDFASYVYTLIQSLAYKEVTALLKKYKSITHCIKSIEPISLAISMTANSKEKLYQLGIETRPAAIVRPAGGAQFLTMSS